MEDELHTLEIKKRCIFPVFSPNIATTNLVTRANNIQWQKIQEQTHIMVN